MMLLGKTPFKLGVLPAMLIIVLRASEHTSSELTGIRSAMKILRGLISVCSEELVKAATNLISSYSAGTRRKTKDGVTFVGAYKVPILSKRIVINVNLARD